MSAASRRGFLLSVGSAGAATLAAGAAGARSVAPGQVPLITSYVAGAHRYAESAAVARLRPGEGLRLVREPQNDYDARAVCVWTERQEKLGYLPRIHNEAVANLMDAGYELVAAVRSAEVGRRPDIKLAIRLPIG